MRVQLHVTNDNEKVTWYRVDIALLETDAVFAARGRWMRSRLDAFRSALKSMDIDYFAMHLDRIAIETVYEDSGEAGLPPR